MWRQITNERFNQGFRGHAEKCVYTFSIPLPDQMGAGWIAQRAVSAHNQALADAGSILLELRVWEDTSPTWQTDYKVEVVASASPLFWNLIIVGVLVVLAIAGVAFTLVKVEDIAQYAPGVIAWGSAGVIALALLGIALVRRR